VIYQKNKKKIRFLSEEQRKEKKIRFTYRKETRDCELCKYWREREYSFCVEHWAKFRDVKKKSLEEWKNNLKNGEE